ncbi:MAG: Hsp20/alpha crystallin family protein [bacterium]|nr:Hsp20/alpha crystallin family protein [bacterium]
MQTIEEALSQVNQLHEQLTQAPAPEIGPQAFLPIPPGVDPVAYAIEEVAHLKRVIENVQNAPATTPPSPVSWSPAANVFASDSKVVYVLELAGVSRDDLSVRVIDGQLVVHGERKPPAIAQELPPMFVEQRWGGFERRFPVPTWCNVEQVEARYEEGMLTIGFERSESSKPSEVQVQVA